MGGPGGCHYDRDTTSSSQRTHRGTTDFSEKFFEKKVQTNDILPYGRKFKVTAKNFLALGLDITGSMDTAPKAMLDRMPNYSRETQTQGYFPDHQIHVGMFQDFIGNDFFNGDQSPIQICDPVVVKGLDGQLKRIFMDEHGGGGQGVESPEVVAYLFAYLVDMTEVKNPYCVFVSDEGFRENECLTRNFLTKVFGGEHSSTNATKVFEDLRKKFNNNVYLIHRPYTQMNSIDDGQVLEMWRRVLGDNNVFIVPEDQAIVDMLLGILALGNGVRTLDGYLEDMRKREQTPARREMIRQIFKNFVPPSLPKTSDSVKADANLTAPSFTEQGIKYELGETVGEVLQRYNISFLNREIWVDGQKVDPNFVLSTDVVDIEVRKRLQRDSRGRFEAKS